MGMPAPASSLDDPRGDGAAHPKLPDPGTAGGGRSVYCSSDDARTATPRARHLGADSVPRAPCAPGENRRKKGAATPIAGVSEAVQPWGPRSDLRAPF